MWYAIRIPGIRHYKGFALKVPGLKNLVYIHNTSPKYDNVNGVLG
jgi:hypothetical protein